MNYSPGGSKRWMSPELLSPEKFKLTDARPTKPSDCYALGMVIYEVCSHQVAVGFRSNQIASGPVRQAAFLGHENQYHTGDN